MLATEEFLKKKKAASSGGSNGGSSGMATDEFFKKKAEEKKITKQPETAVQQETTTGGIDINLDDIKKGVSMPSFGPSQVDTGYSGQGTTSMGQGVKIDQTPFRLEQKKKDDDLRMKQNEIVKNAQTLGQSYIEKLKPEEKDLLISGLERKKAEQPVIRAATENDLSFEDYTQSNHFATLPEEKKSEILNNQAKDPYDPKNWAFFEKQKKKFDTVYEGKTIQADIETMQDDPVENIDIALNIGRDQVFQTIGAIGEWAGISDGTFRKMAETNSEWESVRFNQEMDANDNNILDSRFWTQKVPQSIPFMVALAPAQIGGAAAGGSLATVAGLGTLGKFLLQSGLAGLSSRMTESLAEGADTYATLKDNGVDDEEASKRAWGTAKGNMALAFSDITQMAVTFAPVGKLFPKVAGGTMTKFAVPAGKFIFDGASEGGEEVFQGYVQQYNIAKGLGQEPMSVFEYLQTPEALNAFSLGAASGMMFGGIGVAKDVYDNFSRRAEAQVDMVDRAVAKDDIDFIPKMEVLVQKEAIAQETVDAVKQLLELKVSEEKGVTYDEWVQQGQNERRAKLEEVRTKLQEFNNKRKEEEIVGKSAKMIDSLKDTFPEEIETNIKELKSSDYILEKKDIAQVDDSVWSSNISEYSRKKIDKIKEEIKSGKEFPPIILNSKDSMFDGHHRLQAYKELGVNEVDTLKQVKSDNPSGRIENINTYEKAKVKPMDLTETPQVATISKMETPENVSTPEKPDTGNDEKNTESIESIKKLSDKEIQEKYTPSEILAIEDKENPTPEETAIHDRYISAVEAQEIKKINKEIEAEYEENGQHVAISEDSDVTYRDLEILAQRIAQTLNDPKIRFGLKRSKKNMDMSTKTEKYLKTSKEGTLEALTEEFQSLKNGLKEIIEYYKRTKKHPYTRQKLGELYEALTKGEYDFLESGDVFQETINPYLYEGKKQVSPKVGKTKSEGARGGSKVSDPDSGTPSEEGDKKVGTSKTGIVNALEKVEEEFTKSENKYPTFAEIDKKTAMEASRGTSFDPEKRGEQRIQGFKVEMEELYDEMIQYAKTDEQIEIVRNEVSDLSQKLAVKQNEINRAESGVVSYMITGPARFPVERMRKKNEAIQRKYEDYTELKERAKNAIIKKLKGQEVESVGGPIEALKLEIQKLTEYRDLAKRVNAIIKKHKTEAKIYEALIADGIGEKLAKEASTPVRHSGRIETIMLTNLNNKIKDREAKLEKMQKIEAIQGTEEAVKVLYSFDGGKVIDNRGLDRVQIVFDERPNSDTMYDLKKKGWKWSPKNEAWQRFRNSGSVRVARDMFPEVETKKFQSIELSTKILEKLGDRETVSKEFIQNLTNSGDIKQIEKEMIREVLKTEGEKVNVKEFKEKVKMELLPLKVATKKDRLRKDPNAEDYFADPNRYEYVNLPEDLRGSVKDYRENIYESPVEVSAGNVHFRGQTTQYFGHTRVEDMAGTDPYQPDYTKANGVRRVIEIQSDLYQRGRLEEELYQKTNEGRALKTYIEKFGEKEGKDKLLADNKYLDDDFKRYAIKQFDEAKRLSQYNDPTAHFRMIREELAQASKDGMNVLQFPTGETAMKIEGLGSKAAFKIENKNLPETATMSEYEDLSTENMKVGMEILDRGRMNWIILEVLGDGKINAVPKESTYRDENNKVLKFDDKGWMEYIRSKGIGETFDISGKVDQSNPIYKFYEKEVGRYLKNNYNGKLVTDDKGVSWYQIDITPDMQKKVLAFQDETSDAWIYDIVGEKYKVRPFAKQKIDLQDVYAEAIQLAPEGWNIRVEDPTKENYLEGVVAYADLATKEIVISTTEARKSTAAHETVHAALSELPDNRRKEILNASKRQWEEYTGRKLSKEQSEEFLAEEFKYYIENQKYKTKSILGKIKEFISRLANRIKGVFGKDDKIKTFYDDILAGVQKKTYTGVGKKFQSLSDKELYDQIDAENFGYKLPPKLGAKYELNMEQEKMPSQAWESFKEFSSEILVPIDTIIGNVNKELRDRLWKFEFGVANSKIMQDSRPILKKFQDKLKTKKNDPDYRILDLALKNGDSEVVEYYAEKLGVLKEFEEVRPVLDMIYKEAQAVGIDMKYVESYFPRTVRDAKGLLSYLAKTEYGSQIAEAIKLSEEAKGHELTEDEKAVIANRLLRGFKIAGITLTPPGNTKARTIEEVNKEINPFYNDSMDSLAMYIQGMNENIEARKLFGKGDNLDSSIGAFTMRLMKEGKITPVQEITLTRALQSRFASSKMWAFLQGYRNLAYMTTMGSPISAISQIQDLAFSLYENGFIRTGGAWVRAAFNKSEITRDDLGITNIIHEFTDPTKTAAALTKVFKWVGLEYMDKVGKETLVNGYLVRLREAVAKGDMTDLEVFSQEERAQIVKDLAEGKISEEIRYILFAKLMQYQPITRSQMPKYYNESANGRMFYMLKTYMVKQIDVFRQEAFHDISEGSKKKNKAQVARGFKNLIHLAIALMLMGGLTDLIKNLILNRPIDPTDLVIDNILKLMGFSKYTVYKVKEGTLSEGILSIITPPFNFINDVIVDAYDIADDKMEAPDKLQSINNIPVGGKLYYWWFGKGATKSEKKREKIEKAGQVKIKTTPKNSPFSQDLNFSDNSKAFKQTLNFK